MNTEHLIVRSDEILGGTPVFAGTRVPVQTLFDYLNAGESLDRFRDDFPGVSPEQANAVGELDEQVWQIRVASTQDNLAEMAAKAREDIQAGRVRKMGFDELR